jgi:uncharacterized protein (TIGR00725 family)
MPPARPAHIAVIGPGEASDQELIKAREVGRLLAQSGAVLICGGLGGVMAGACEGASHHAGMTVGILPGLERSEANEYVQLAIPTGMGELRNGLVVYAADALIAVGGGWGTLSEIALARRSGRVVVRLGGGPLDFADPAGLAGELVSVDTAQRAVRRALQAAAQRR